MKILLVNKFFHLNGGSETVFFQERGFLLEHGHSVIDFSMADDRNIPSPYADFFVPNISYQNIGGITQKINKAISFIHSSIAVKKIDRLVVQEQPDIAHLHNIYHQLTPAIIPVLKKHGVQVVLTLHDCKLICPSYLALSGDRICDNCQGKYFWKPFTTNCQNSRLQELLLAGEAFWHRWKRSYDGVDLFIAPSQFMANLVGKRIPKNKIQVLHNGIDIDKYQPSDTDQGYALYFGRLSRGKGVETLLQAFQQTITKFSLKIVGTGSLGDDLCNKYPGAEFLGYKTGQELEYLIANAAFVVIPSEWYENCSMVVLESMSFGKPIIGSRIGGIPEQIEDGRTGLLFDMGNVAELAEKMDFLINNAQLRVEMGHAAREKLEAEYALGTHCNDLIGYYNQLISK